MLAFEIYYVDIITFVYKMSLFHPHNAQEHSAFCPLNYSSVHASMCLLQYFMDTMLIRVIAQQLTAIIFFITLLC